MGDTAKWTVRAGIAAAAVLALISVLEFLSPIHSQICQTDFQAAKHTCASYEVTFGQIGYLGDFLDRHNGAITALATVFVASFTVVLATSSRQQARLTREAMIASQRAFVFATDLLPNWYFDPTVQLYGWRFRPVLENSGETPTRDMRMSVRCLIRTDTLPRGYDFSQAASEVGTGLLAPKQKSQGGLAPTPHEPCLTPQDLIESQAGTKYIYLVGWARYRDVFPDTPEHLTRFCWFISPNGNPSIFDPQKANLRFDYIHHYEGNCADDECRN